MAKSESGKPQSESSQVEVGSVSDVNDSEINIAGRDVRKVQSGTYIEHATIIQQPEVGYPESEAPAPGEAPYKGLQYFDVSDAGLFFGRETLIAGLVNRLHNIIIKDELRFLAVVGASGSGKSSLARAGLAASLANGEKLEDGTTPPQGAAEWPQHIITPGNQPIESLAASLTRSSESVTATATLIDDLNSDERSLHLYARKLLSQDGAKGDHLFLLVDQFEELFTQCGDVEDCEKFLKNLLYAAGVKGGPVIVVLTLRADFYAHCARYEALRDALARQQEYIGAMNTDELRRAIETPAKEGGWEFEPGLVDLLLRDVGSEPGALPLLSHALLETWQRRRGKLMTLEGYHDAGGVHGAIAHTADRVYGGLSTEEQAIARKIFLRLTELGEDTRNTRRRADLDELLRVSPDPQLSRRVLDILADTEARLVITGEDNAEVAHEALIREWPALRGWLVEAQEDLLLHRRLNDAAEAWEKLARDPGDLYRGARLAQALEWAQTHSGEMSSLERDFLEASRVERARRARSKRLLWIGVAALVVLFIVTLAVTGLLNRLIYSPMLRAPVKAEIWIDIPAGEFTMGSSEVDLEAYLDTHQDLEDERTQYELPAHRVYLDNYQLMSYEVNNRQYNQCVRAGVCETPFNKRYDEVEYSDHPVTDVDWFMAETFCHWAGGRLPTEAEWERAARGGFEGNYFPWGNDQADCARANFFDVLSDQRDVCIGETSPVGSYPPNDFGLYDMSGNAWEWVADWFDPEYYTDSPVENPQGPEEGDHRVMRGGSWHNWPVYLRVAYREDQLPNFTDDKIGFRCARDP